MSSVQAGKRFPTEPAGYLFDKFGLIFLLFGLVLAVWFRQTVIVILIGLILSAAAVSKLWSRFSLVGVTCERILSEQRAFPDERIELKLHLVNRKLLPLPWIQVDDEVPMGFLARTALPPASKPGWGLLSKATALLWYTGATWRQQLVCHKRGYYSVGPMTLTSGDIFGFYPRSLTIPQVDHIIVYPKIFPVAKLGLPSRYPLGETVAELRIFQDHSRVIGVRDFTPGDSRKYIHWKASARHQSLQVKVFEPTTSLKVALFVAVDTFQMDGLHSEDNFELAISTAASLANYLIEKDSQVGLYVNSRLAASGEPARILPASNAGHLVDMLEALAKVTTHPSAPFVDFFQAERTKLPWGTTLVFILSRSSQTMTDLLFGLKERGQKLIVMQVGESVEGAEQSVPWHNICQPDALVKIGDAA